MKNQLTVCFYLAAVLTCVLLITSIALFFSRIAAYGWFNLLFCALAAVLAWQLYTLREQNKSTRNLK